MPEQVSEASLAPVGPADDLTRGTSAPAVAPAETTTAGEPLLRTLAPLLRHLSEGLETWKNTPRVAPLDVIVRSALEGIELDLKRKADSLSIDQPLLVIVFFGGTGVGKSSLLNALAGSPIAPASYTRPTTREPVVYHHRDVSLERLGPGLRNCRLVAHDRPELRDKVLVDTPDLDSSDVSNRDRLVAVLPMADIVLFVGSQEKYLDQVGWKLFRTHRQRSAFAFVMNKWDRSLHAANSSGERPDQNLIAELNKEGFSNPIIFRTVAQHHLDNPGQPCPTPGEQFVELARWLAAGLTAREMEAIKARGVDQLLNQFDRYLTQATPADLQSVAPRVVAQWKIECQREAKEATEVLLQTLDRHQMEIEGYFRTEGQQRFRGLMALYLAIVAKAKSLGATLRSPLAVATRTTSSEPVVDSTKVQQFLQGCVATTGERVFDKRLDHWVDRLLVSSGPLGLSAGVVSPALQRSRREVSFTLYEKALLEAWQKIDNERKNPAGARRWLQRLVVQAGNVVPGGVLVLGYIYLFWYFFALQSSLSLFQFLVPPALAFLSVLFFQLLVHWVLPFTWSSVREELAGELEQRITQALENQFTEIPDDLARKAELERLASANLQQDITKTREWLNARQSEASSIESLYGKSA